MAEGSMRGATRRGLLLGATGLLGGCDWISDSVDKLFGESKTPLPGEREPVLAADRGLAADTDETRPVTLPPAVENPAWPQAMGVLGHNPGHPALGQGLRRVWSTDVGAGAGYRRRLTAPPLVAGDTVYAMDAIGEVTAVDAATGRSRWSTDTRKPKERGGALGGGLAVDGNTVYVATGLAEAMSLDAATGAIGWRVALPAPARGCPTVAGGRMILPLIDNRVLSLATDTGEKQWEHRGQPTTTMVLGLPAPAIEGEMAVCGLASGEVIALRLDTGRPAWSEALSTLRGGSLADITAITALPVIDKGRVFAAGLGGIAIALDLRSGRRLWERDATFGETPWVVGDWMFAVTVTGSLVCISLETGRVRWLTSLPRFGNPAKKRDPITWGPPTIAGGRLLIGNGEGEMLEVNPLDGSRMGTTKMSDSFTLAPAIAGSTLYVLTDDAQLTAYRGS